MPGRTIMYALALTDAEAPEAEEPDGPEPAEVVPAASPLSLVLAGAGIVAAAAALLRRRESQQGA